MPAKAGIQKFLIFLDSGSRFRLRLISLTEAIASLPGMTPKLFNGFQEHHIVLVACRECLRDMKSRRKSLPRDALLPDAAGLGTMGHGTADGVNGIVGDEQVNVGPL